MAQRVRTKTTTRRRSRGRAPAVVKPTVAVVGLQPAPPILALRRDNTQFSVFSTTAGFASHEQDADRTMFPTGGWQLFDSAGRELQRIGSGLGVAGDPQEGLADRLRTAIRHSRGRLRRAVRNREAPSFIRGDELDDLDSDDLSELLADLGARVGSGEHSHEHDGGLKLAALPAAPVAPAAPRGTGGGSGTGAGLASAGAGGGSASGGGVPAGPSIPAVITGFDPIPDAGSWLHYMCSPHHW